MKEPKRRAPRLPEWLIDQIDPDIDALGRGAQHHGGSQSLFITALLLYLDLPKADRLELAALMSSRAEASVLRDFDSHWIGRAMKALSELGETSVPTLEGAVQAVRARRQEAGRSDTPGTAAASREGADHRSRRRRGA